MHISRSHPQVKAQDLQRCWIRFRNLIPIPFGYFEFRFPKTSPEDPTSRVFRQDPESTPVPKTSTG